MELENRVIFILGATKYDGAIESTSFNTAKYLARKNRVFYIDFPFTYKDTLIKDNADQIHKRKFAFKGINDGLVKYDIAGLEILILPLLLPINFIPEGKIYRKLLYINESKIARRINRVIKKFALKDFVFINSFNFHYPNIGSMINANTSAYHCVDPLIVGYDIKHGVVSEEIVVKQSDLVICTSKELASQKRKINLNTFFIPNAADLSVSSKALDQNLPTHHMFLAISKPVIGYFGNIERRMDFELLYNVALNNSNKSFVFVGPVDEDFVPAEFRKLDNVFFLGKVPYALMPNVIKGFDIAIIPFKKDDVSSTIFPLKLFEYLGTGKPVVSTDFNMDLDEFTKGTVDFCSDEKSFTRSIDNKLSQDSIENIERRLKIASENTWEIRLQQLSELINRFYHVKPGRS